MRCFGSLRTVILSALLALGVEASAWQGAFYYSLEVPLSARTPAIGGLHAALVDDITAILTNPAGFRSVKPQFNFGEATIAIDNTALTIMSEMLNGTLGSKTGRSAHVNMLGPLNFTYVGKGMGFGLILNTSLKYRDWGTPPFVRAQIYLEEDLLALGGYTFRIKLPANSALDLGLLAKGFLTFYHELSPDIADLAGFNVDLVPLIAGSPFILARGIGADAGILYSYKNVFSVGVVGRDFASVIRDDYASLQSFLNSAAGSARNVFLPMDISFGLCWRPPLGRLYPTITSLTLLADYRDAFDFLIYPPRATNPWLHISAGLELVLLEILTLRAGFYQCLPSGGVGIDLSLFKLNFAFYGRELSAIPGGRPIYIYMLGVEI
jgi:hypothetical protein